MQTQPQTRSGHPKTKERAAFIRKMVSPPLCEGCDAKHDNGGGRRPEIQNSLDSEAAIAHRSLEPRTTFAFAV